MTEVNPMDNGTGAEVLNPDMARAIIDPAAYGNSGRIFDVHKWLRANNPVARAEIGGYDPFWVLTKHGDIRDVSARSDLFPSGLTTIFLTDKASRQQIRESTGGDPNLSRSILTMDEPEHGKFRRLTQAWFMPRNLKTLENRVRRLARQQVDEMLASDQVGDFAADVAVHFPLRVILEIMGIAQSEEPYVLKLTRELLGAQDPEYSRMGQHVDATKMAADMAKVFADFTRYFTDILEDRRREPRDDVASLIAQGMIDGEPLTATDAVGYYTTLATAGHDTTSSTLAGAIAGLCEFPEELHKAKADSRLIPGLVEEALRWTTPIRHFMRTAAADVEIRGRKIRSGETLMLNYLSGNRDEEIFHDPYLFKIDRRPNPHLALGYGAHMCLGQHLAKMELRIFFEELLPRVSAMTLAGPPHQVDTILIGGLKSLPIRVTREGTMAACK
jgi:cytochrome P450